MEMEQQKLTSIGLTLKAMATMVKLSPGASPGTAYLCNRVNRVVVTAGRCCGRDGSGKVNRCVQQRRHTVTSCEEGRVTSCVGGEGRMKSEDTT